jgi:hypothetical protein
MFGTENRDDLARILNDRNNKNIHTYIYTFISTYIHKYIRIYMHYIMYIRSLLESNHLEDQDEDGKIKLK